MIYDKRKVVIIGAGMVGMSYAYALLNQGVCNELVLIDLNRKRAEGEAQDLNHGAAFSPSGIKVSAGDYPDCKDADIVVICAGVAQKPGESRINLLQRNTEVFRQVVTSTVKSGFNGIFIVATNPVDIMTRVVCDISGFPAHRVIGSGTTLDTARLRYLLGTYFDVDPRNVHAYVIGEHGDSEFVPWSQAMVATKRVYDILNENTKDYKIYELEKIADDVSNAAYSIIDAKGATYYGIGMALVRITKAIFNDENSVLTVSTKFRGEYGINDTFMGIPGFVNRGGVKKILRLDLTDDEIVKLKQSAATLDNNYKHLSVQSKEKEAALTK
ncbi:MAG: L-lactate dehydrogenase [Clostridiales bacterium]|nr:L-lactate dehydrogenase [Clostridiales bacterium]